MNLYDKIKDFAKLVQKADNIDLYKQALDLASQAQDQQDEIRRLREENKKLNELLATKGSIVRNVERYLTIDGDSKEIKYCSHCWDADQKLIQLDWWEDGSFSCPHCKNKAIYDIQKFKKSHPQQKYGVINKGIKID